MLAEIGAGSIIIILNNPWGLEEEKIETETCGQIKHECYESAKWKCRICLHCFMILEAGRKASSSRMVL